MGFFRFSCLRVYDSGVLVEFHVGWYRRFSISGEYKSTPFRIETRDEKSRQNEKREMSRYL